MKISRETVRRLMLEKQGFGTRPETVTKEDIFHTVDRLGCVQIDTINVVERAHYLTLWSRLGCYNKELLHDLAYRDRVLFEHWAHAASYIPTKDYRFFVHAMEVRKVNINKTDGRKVEPEVLEHVLGRIRNEGPMAARDFEHKRERPSRGWWDWKPAKIALEALFGAGVILVDRRENFQRYYDLAERVLPSWVGASEPADEERVRFFLRRTMGCLGLIAAPEVRNYYQHWCVKLGRTSRQLQATMDELVNDGEAHRFKFEGERRPYYCLPDDADRIAMLEEDFGFDGVSFLTNFDNLLWIRERVKDLFGFEVKMETYVPVEKRRYGYFNLPILHGDRLVGRIVPKMDRKRWALLIRSIWHEPWFEPDEAFEDKFGGALDSFAKFNGAESVEMQEDEPLIG